MEQIVGRKTEITQLTEYFNSGKAEFVAVYGRRRDFVEETGVRHGILPTLITTFGIRPNAHSAIAQVQLTMDDLFDDMAGRTHQNAFASKSFDR